MFPQTNCGRTRSKLEFLTRRSLTEANIQSFPARYGATCKPISYLPFFHL